MAILRPFFFLVFFPVIASAITINNFSPKSVTATWDSGTPGAISNAGGAWNLDATNFTYDNGVKNSPFCQGCNVSFGAASGGVAGTVTTTGIQRINSMTFGPVGSGNFTITGGEISCVNSNSCTYTTNVSGTIASLISGSKELIKAGTAELTLTATNTYSGGTTLSVGALTATSTNAFGSGTITLGDANTGANNITLNFDKYEGTLSNPITVSSSGFGTVAIHQSNTRSILNGPMTLNRPTIISSTGSDRVDVSSKITGNVGTLTVNANPRITMTNSLADTSDFIGNVVITNGALQLNTPYAIPPTADVTVNASGTFRLVGGANSTIAIDALDGSGLVYGHTGGANILKTLSIGNAGGTGTFTGPIENGSAGDTLAITKAGTGTETFSGLNTYTGATTVNAGTLKLTSPAYAITSPASVASGATLELNATSGTFAAPSLTNLTITGSGTVNVTGNNSNWIGISNVNCPTLTGLINVSNSALVFGWWGLNAPSAQINVEAGGKYAVGNNGGSVGILTGAGDVFQGYNASTATLTIGSDNRSGTFSGVIHGNGTSGTQGNLEHGVLSLTKAGTGIQNLTAANTYTGSTTLTNGSLLLSGSGNLASTGSLVLNSGNSVTFGVGTSTVSQTGLSFPQNTNNTTLTLTGTGSLNITGATQITLAGGSGTSGYTQTLNIQGPAVTFTPTLLIASNVSSGGVPNNGNLNITSGTLNLGTLQTAYNSYTGGGFAPGTNATITVSGTGTLKVQTFYFGSGTRNAGSDVSRTYLNINTGGSVYAGVINNSMQSTTNGLVTITINGGTLYNYNSTTALVISNPSAFGPIGITLGASGGTININTATGSSISPVISGAGALTKAGTGALTLSGNNTFTGNTTINAGTLICGHLNCLGTGTITVNAGGTLNCNNFEITNGILNNGGTIQNCRRTFLVSGSYTVPTGMTSIRYLVVAGGGGGGGRGGANVSGAGGGAGGFLTSTVAVVPGNTYPITVGAGGAQSIDANPTRGGDSSIGALVIATGGGGGGAGAGVGNQGASGGSGGGSVGGSLAGGLGTAGQGSNGGRGSTTCIGCNVIGAGGGGGAGGAGGAGLTGPGNAPGGAGLVSSFSGATVTYAAGGTGGDYPSSASGANGAANTGNGGGGGGGNGNANGGSGGSGIVIILPP